MGGVTEGFRRKELPYNVATLVPKRQAHILEAERDCRFPIAIVSIRKDGVVACSAYPIDPFAWTGGAPVTTSAWIET